LLPASGDNFCGMNEPSKVFTHIDFYQAFLRDLRRAVAWVVICSPYLTGGRLKNLLVELRACVLRGVRVCVFLQLRKNRSGEPEVNLFHDAAVQLLLDAGIHVNFREGIHEKVAIIDEHILWEGSLNILSHYNTSERQRRWECAKETRAAVRLHHLDGCGTCGEEFGMMDERKNLERIGQAVADARRKCGWSQAQLAAHADVAQRVISNIENGNDARISTILKICEQLDAELCFVEAFLMPALNDLKARCKSR
jgi:DNA-binding XRE family transcriptional regulator